MELRDFALIAAKDYKKWVLSNVGAVTEVESLLRLGSYLVSGRCPKTQWLSELVYSAANLVTLANDCILRRASSEGKPADFSEETVSWLQVGLAVLEYVEVLFETLARRLFGDAGKWIVVCVLQICRTVWRAALLVSGKFGVLTSPPIKKLDREKLKEPKSGAACADRGSADAVTLSRSGRRMRKLDGAPSWNMRNWRVPAATIPNGGVCGAQACSQLTTRQLVAEMIYVSRPLTHLGLMFACGQKSWRPWVASLALDCASLALHRRHLPRLRPEERSELVNRSLSLLLYLLRSPFYDRWTRARALAALAVIPGVFRPAGLVCHPLAKYLPEWQRTYFYVWSS